MEQLTPFEKKRIARETRARRFIAEKLPVALAPGLPAIKLHLAVPHSGVWQLAPDGVPPYWAWCWPGGLALAVHLRAHPELVSGRSVFDLGTGSGLVAIAAAMAGAHETAGCDIDVNGLVAVGLNAALNAVTIKTVLADPLDGPAPMVEVILVGDLFYDFALAQRVIAFLDTCLDAGVEIYIGDIGREHLPEERLRALAAYPLVDFAEPATAKPRLAQVWRYIGASG
ncbi:class I SAM-dependent methyltransferase [Pelagibacterium sp.]|uniref:class I SAM-dependent methyltransferase n=1 Tax=Pelagibacterium sp. TaxID=1967288 RepID=UPI003A937BF0